MKKQLLLVTTLITGMASAQTMDQSNEPAIGDLRLMYTCDSTTPKLENTTGSAVTWDYSQLIGLNGQTKTIELIDPATSPNAASFTTSTKAFNIQGSLTNYFNSTTNQRVGQGFVFEEPSFGSVLAVFDVNEQIMVNYPFALNDNLADPFEGQLTFEFNGVPQNPTCTGRSYASIDGSGTLKLPGSVNLSNVIRYKTVDTVFTQVSFVIPLDVEIIREQYEYYDFASGNLPVFVYSSVTIQQIGATTPLIEQSVILSSEQPTSNAGLENLSALNVSIFPNPANDQLVFSGDLKGLNMAKIVDATGREVKTIVFDGFNTGAKICDVTDLTSGNYFVQLTGEGGIQQTKHISIK
jgi:hypothetical protein